MDVEDEPSVYLVHIKLSSNDEPIITRLRESLPTIQKTLEKLSVCDPQQAYRSDSGAMFGYFIKSHMSAHAIRAQVESPGTSDHKRIRDENLKPIPSPTQLKDKIFVVDIGKDYSDTNMNMVTLWMERNHSRL